MGCWFPAVCCLRPLGLWRPSRSDRRWRRACAGAGRKHLRDDELARTAIAWLGSSMDRLLDVRVDVDGRERLLAELAQDVVGAAAELAGDRERGALVVGPFAHLQEVLVVGRGLAGGLLAGLVQRPAQPRCGSRRRCLWLTSLFATRGSACSWSELAQTRRLLYPRVGRTTHRNMSREMSH